MKQTSIRNPRAQSKPFARKDLKTNNFTPRIPGQLCFLLFIFIFSGSCNGQIKTHEPKTGTVGQPKMIRTQGLKYGNVVCELQDKAGNLWFSTSGEGVYRYDGQFFTNFTNKEGLGNNSVSAITEDQTGNILFGTKSGISRYDGKSFTPYTDNDDASKKSITCLLSDRDGNLWFGTMESGVYRYDGKTFTNFLNHEDDGQAVPDFMNKEEHPFNLGRPNQLILDILQDKNGHIWFSSWNGGGVWRYDGTSFKNYLPDAGYYERNEDGRSVDQLILPEESSVFNEVPQDHISDDMIFSISEDKAGNLWFATRRHGACRYDGKLFTNFTGRQEVNGGFYAVVEDKNGNFWFGTDKDGVFRYDGKSYKNFTEKDGLTSNSVFSIFEDKSGLLWFGTRGFGLSRYDGKSFTRFSE